MAKQFDPFFNVSSRYGAPRGRHASSGCNYPEGECMGVCMTSKPLAASGLKSYRYRGGYGWIMIGAKDYDDALKQAQRSLSHGTAKLVDLEFWNGQKYEPIVPAILRNQAA